MDYRIFGAKEESVDCMWLPFERKDAAVRWLSGMSAKFLNWLIIENCHLNLWYGPPELNDGEAR